jgi:hypothetical protein
MRTDAKIDQRSVKLPNVQFTGYNKHEAEPGYFVVWNDNGERKLCRVIARVAFAPECGDKERNTWSPEIRNQLMVGVLNSSVSSIYLRWIKPEDVQECYSPEDYAECMQRVFARFTSDAFINQSPEAAAHEMENIGY